MSPKVVWLGISGTYGKSKNNLRSIVSQQMVKLFHIIIKWLAWWEVVAGASYAGGMFRSIALIFGYSPLFKLTSTTEATIPGYLAQHIKRSILTA